MKEERIKINGLEIYYKIIGEGKPLLILHGWGSRTSRWLTVSKLLAGRGFKIIIPDLPGFGHSDKPKSVWGIKEYASFVEDFVKQIDLKDFYLLGHSFGGAVASFYSVSVNNASKIKRLFLVSAACIREKGLKKKSIKSFAKIFKFLKYVPFAKGIFYRFIVKTDYHLTKGVVREIYLKVIDQDLTDELEKIKVGTCLIWGENDNITPLRHGEKIHSKIKDSVLEIIPNAGHDLNLDSPGRLADTVVKCL